MAISYLSNSGKPKTPDNDNNSLRINFDRNLRKWFSRNLGVWRSCRQYLFEDEEAVSLEMFIKYEKISQSNQGCEMYSFKWWCENDYEFFLSHPSLKRDGFIEETLQGHKLFRNRSDLSESSIITSIRQVDEHELIFESNFGNWSVLEHTRLIDEDRYRSRLIYSWEKERLKIVESHHEIRI